MSVYHIINTLDKITWITNSNRLLYSIYRHCSYHRCLSRSHVVIVVVIIIAVIMIPSSPLSSSSSSLRRYRYRPSSDGGGLGRGHVLVPDCDPRGSPTRTLPPRRRDTPKVTRPSFWILEGHGWVRCDIGSREATPISVFSERGHPALTRNHTVTMPLTTGVAG